MTIQIIQYANLVDTTDRASNTDPNCRIRWRTEHESTGQRNNDTVDDADVTGQLHQVLLRHGVIHVYVLIVSPCTVTERDNDTVDDADVTGQLHQVLLRHGVIHVYVLIVRPCTLTKQPLTNTVKPLCNAALRFHTVTSKFCYFLHFSRSWF